MSVRPSGVRRLCQWPSMKSCNQRSYVRTASSAIRAQVVSAKCLVSLFDDKDLVLWPVPIVQSIGFTHVRREWISLPGANDRLHNAPYRAVITASCTPHKHSQPPDVTKAPAGPWPSAIGARIRRLQAFTSDKGEAR